MVIKSLIFSSSKEWQEKSGSSALFVVSAGGNFFSFFFPTSLINKPPESSKIEDEKPRWHRNLGASKKNREKYEKEYLQHGFIGDQSNIAKLAGIFRILFAC